MPSRTLDFSELNVRHPRDQFRRFRVWAESTNEGSHRARDAVRSVVVIMVIGFSLILVVSFALMLAGTLFSMVNWLTGLLLGLLVGGFVFLSLVRLIDIWRRDVRFGVGMRHWMAMDRFARSNDMIYVPEIIAPAYGGTVFTIGKARRACDVVATTVGRYVEIGNYSFCGETAFNRSLNQCGYVRVEVDRPIPHLYLRSRRSLKFGATFAREQEFSLEGDFGKHFRLYAPGGFERDALYILTPDLMAILIDEAGGFDVEFVDQHIYFYAPRRFTMRDPATYRRVAGLVDSVVDKAVKQTRGYTDFRSGGGFVTAQGSRLRRGLTVAAVAAGILFVAQLIHLAGLLFPR